MPNKHAAIKDLRKNRRHASMNLRMKTHVKTLLKNSAAAIKTGDKGSASELARALQKAIDKAAKKGVVSTNASRRKKAALMKKLNVMTA